MTMPKPTDNWDHRKERRYRRIRRRRPRVCIYLKLIETTNKETEK